MNLIIRKAEESDADAIARILRETGWFTYMKHEHPEDTAIRVKTHLRLCLINEAHSVYVAQADGTLAGYVSFHRLPSLFLPCPET